MENKKLEKLEAMRAEWEKLHEEITRLTSRMYLFGLLIDEINKEEEEK